MAKKRKRNKNIFKSTFYRIYFALVLVCIIGIAAGAMWLNGLLVDYEASQPVYAIGDTIRLFENGDYEIIYALDESAQEISDGDRDFYVESLKEISAGKQVSWSEGYSGSEDERVYSVLLDEEKS